jgi:CRISPR-associated protein Csb1
MPNLNLDDLKKVNRLLLSVPLRPVQGDRFQPTGFPSLGAATYQTREGPKLLVESAQSMANRLETTCWDNSKNAPVEALNGISHVTVMRNDIFLTDSMLESHRINSPYILTSSDRAFLDPFLQDLRVAMGKELIDQNEGLISRNGLAKTILKYDVGSLIHGVFFATNKVKLEANAKPGSIAGGRLRLARALSVFIEASGISVAASGGVKNDHVNPSGDTKSGFGNVPFSRDEYVANQIDCYINFDLAQIRGYGFESNVQDLLILLALYRVQKLLAGDLRLRAACDLKVDENKPILSYPEDFKLPSLLELKTAVEKAIGNCKDADGKPLMVQTTATFGDELKKGGEEPDTSDNAGDEEATDESSEQ